MGIIISDSGGCISIENDGVALLVSKLHIKTIDTVGRDAVRINIGEGPLRNIYIKQSEMVTPNVENVYELRDFIKNLLPANNAVGSGSLEQQQYDVQLQIRDILQQLYNFLTAV
jgi:hypothetical protein